MLLRRLAALATLGRTRPVGPAALGFDVGPGTCTVLDDAVGVQIRCLEGALWLTQDGRREDIELRPGDSTRIAHEGRTLVVASGHTRFTAHGMWRPGASRPLVREQARVGAQTA